MNKYPRVLIIGETFHKRTGGGITISNFFKDWPSENIAVISRSMIWLSDPSYCKNLYKIDTPSIAFRSFLSKSTKGGPIPAETLIDNNSQNENKNSCITGNRRGKRIKRILTSLLKRLKHISTFLGISYLFNNLLVTDELRSWIKEFNPDIIYFPPTDYQQIKFVLRLRRSFPIPLAIHPMDDHVRMMYPKGILYYYWKDRINKDFQKLTDISVLHFSICQHMSSVYKSRYNHNFVPIHNPIELDKWLPYSKKDWTINTGCKILYAGRYGYDNDGLLHKLSLIIENLNRGSYNIGLDLRFSVFGNEKK